MSKPLENALIKAAHRKETWTEEQIKEMLKCADPDTGPAYFMNNYFYIQHPTRGSILYKAYPFQDRLIDTYHRYRFSVSLMPRQTGKCLKGETEINIKNNNTGKEYRIPIEIYYEFIKAKENGSELPDISAFEVKTL